MAGFLRKKNNKQVPVKPVPSAPIPLAAATPPQPPPSTPLYARFASKTSNAPPRIVSSPMVLSGKKEQWRTTAVDTPKKRTTQNQGPTKALPQLVQLPPLTPPTPIINKPLPPPTPDPSGSPPTQSFKQVRSPPSAFQKQPQPQLQPSQGRPLDDAGDKQFSRPPSAQSFYSVQTSHTDQGLIPIPASRPATANSNNNSLTSPHKRNSPLSNGPQTLPPLVNRKMHEQPPAFGRQNLPTTVQTQTPHLFQSSSAANQDLRPTNVTTLNGNNMIGASSTPMGIQPSTAQGTPQSDRLEVDLPPEFALFHEFSKFNLEDQSSVQSHRIPSTINPKERVPASNVPPSSMYSDSQSIAPRSAPLSLGHSRESLPLQRPQVETQPPLPPPSQSAMGVTSSHAIGNGLLPSSVKDFYSPRVFQNPNLQSSSYNNPNPNSSSGNQPQMLNQRHPPSSLPNSDFSTNFSATSNRTRASSYQDLQQPTSGSRYSHAPTVPMKGKPRIFAALAVQEDELNREAASGGVQSDVKKLLSQSIQQCLPQHQPSASEFNAHTNGSDQTFSSSLHPRRSVPATPKVSAQIPEQPPPTPPSHNVSTRSSRPKPDEHTPSQPIPKTPSRNRKLSKPRTPDGGSLHLNGSNVTLPSTPDSYHRGTKGSARTLTKSRPTTPVAVAHKPSFTSSKLDGAPLEPAIQLDEDTISKAGIPLDDDPFARVEGVTLLKPSNSLKENDKKDNDSIGGSSHGKKKHRNKQSSKSPSVSSRNDVEDGSPEEGERRSVVESEKASSVVQFPPTPISPEERRKTRKKQGDDDSQTDPTPQDLEDAITIATVEDEDEPEPEPIFFYPMAEFLSDPQILSSLLTFLSFYDWCVLSSLSKEIRTLLVSTPELRETVLERFLKTVGYSRWTWDDPDPLSLSLQDLSDYMRGVSTPTHEYARVAAMHVHSLTLHPNHRDPMLPDIIQTLTASTRAYTRVILRLRAQAEKEATLAQQSRGLLTTIKLPNFNSPYSARGTQSRVSSRAPSPTASSYSLSHNGHNLPTSAMQQHNPSQTSLSFRSPLFRLRRAPLLRVFVPSPEGDWLSDKSVLACEAECKRAGVSHLMRLGDVVWDVAVGDEGNVGRLVWDGSYLIDLDYTYTSIGDLPKYMPTLAFPPSYFHRVIRTGPVINNPIVHIDISPWGEEIAMNLQLLQDRVRTETPQGTYHNVVRWVHRSSFMVRPRRYSHQVGKAQYQAARIPIPETDNLYVDPGWYGTIVVETEGTNEALADLQERCGPGAFPARSRWIHHHPQINQIQIENRKVFRILREKSRPGEIWIKAVGIKERLL